MVYLAAGYCRLRFEINLRRRDGRGIEPITDPPLEKSIGPESSATWLVFSSTKGKVRTDLYLPCGSPYHLAAMDSTTFNSTIETLHPFYSLLGEAAATLLGLLFVSVTFNRQILDPAAGSSQRRHAENIFRQFVFLVWLALAMLLPLSPPELGGSLLLQSLAFFLWIFVGFCRSFLASHSAKDRSFWKNYLLNFATYLGAAWAGCLLLGWSAEPSNAFSILITVSFLALFSGLYGVWRLMVQSVNSPEAR
jgi:hypothetical protein